jgi:hypothetical protein
VEGVLGLKFWPPLLPQPFVLRMIAPEKNNEKKFKNFFIGDNDLEIKK